MSKDKCPVCHSSLNEAPTSSNSPSGHGYTYRCPRCGEYFLPGRSQDFLDRYLSYNQENREENIALLSHAIRKMQRQNRCPRLNLELIKQILEDSLPNPSQQADNLILWLGENLTDPGKHIKIKSSSCISIMGAKSLKGVVFIFKHLQQKGLLEENSKTGYLDARLTIAGWDYYEQLKRGAVDSRQVFMAMEYNDSELDEMVGSCFKTAVKETGFELKRLDENQPAGLIDDHLRVEIKTSRFLIADLTHGNAGAYWEAGYAEGLGKPVIYTCRKDAFDDENRKPHFDTNHHLIVVWKKSEQDKAAEKLKDIIRATLPGEAKLTDD